MDLYVPNAAYAFQAFRSCMHMCGAETGLLAFVRITWLQLASGGPQAKGSSTQGSTVDERPIGEGVLDSDNNR